MRVLFMGTPAFAATILEKLIDSEHQVVGVITRPDAVRGRGKQLDPSPVKVCAQAASIPVLEFKSLRNAEAQAELASFDADVFCVAAYGAILPKAVLDMPRFGCLNAHASLLPRWRGAAPIERAILAGDKLCGCSIMQMEEGLDTGAFTEVRTISIEEKNAEELTAELAEAGGSAMVAVLDMLEAGKTPEWTVQDESQVTYAEKLTKAEFELNPSQRVEDILAHVRAAGESHPCRCVIAGKPLTLLDAKAVLDEIPGGSLACGDVRFIAKRLFAGCSDGVIEILRVKPDGKKELDAPAFAAGIQGIKKLGSTWAGLDG